MIDFVHHQRFRPHTRAMTKSELIVVFFTVASHETHSVSNHTLTPDVSKV